MAVIDLKNDYPELANAILNGKMTRDEAVAMAILKRAVADLTENVPKLWEATTTSRVTIHENLKQQPPTLIMPSLRSKRSRPLQRKVEGSECKGNRWRVDTSHNANWRNNYEFA